MLKYKNELTKITIVETAIKFNSMIVLKYIWEGTNKTADHLNKERKRTSSSVRSSYRTDYKRGKSVLSQYTQTINLFNKGINLFTPSSLIERFKELDSIHSIRYILLFILPIVKLFQNGVI